MKHYNFGSIGQFRDIIKQIKMEAEYQGKDEDGKAIYDSNAVKPTLTFTGTVKLHGTNAAIVYSKEHGLYAQSRERVITPLSDNAGFAFYVESNKECFTEMLTDITSPNWDGYDTVVVFGEWAGNSVQHGVAISDVKKQFYPFLMKYFKNGEETLVTAPYGGEDSWLFKPKVNVFPITYFQTFKIDIDFNNPSLVQNELIRITEEVERECPVAKYFGFSGVGEGVVWTADWNGKQYRFKVKGEKHSSSKVKTLASVDVDKIENCEKFAEYAVTDIRFEQAIKVVFGEEEPQVKRIGELLKWMNTDILKEEIDTLVQNGLEYKDVARYVAESTKKRFFAAYV